MFVLVESLLRKSPSLNSEVLEILDRGLEVNVIGEKVLNDDDEFIKIEYAKGEGYVICGSIGDKAPLKSNNTLKSISKESKIKLINEAFKILKQNTSYSAKLDNNFYPNGKTRANGYYNVPYVENGNKIYSYDCSAFCSTIINRTFDENMQREGAYVQIEEHLKKPNLWTTKDFLANAKKEDAEKKKFLLIQDVLEFEKSISIDDMEIGDLLIGIIDFHNENHNKVYIMNHIMLYVGDKYIVHASFSNGVEIFDRVLFTKLKDDFYTKLSFDRRFDKEIAVVRYNQKQAG